MKNLIENEEFKEYISETLFEVVGRLNLKAQVLDTGLSKEDDDLRQRVCNILTALDEDGNVHCGNLSRIHEAKEFALNLK